MAYDDPRCCEAAAMDYAVFGSADDTVPPCDDLAEFEVDGYALCAGCTEALRILSGLGERAIVTLGVLALRAALAVDQSSAAESPGNSR